MSSLRTTSKRPGANALKRGTKSDGEARLFPETSPFRLRQRNFSNWNLIIGVENFALCRARYSRALTRASLKVEGSGLLREGAGRSGQTPASSGDGKETARPSKVASRNLENSGDMNDANCDREPPLFLI